MADTDTNTATVDTGPAAAPSGGDDFGAKLGSAFDEGKTGDTGQVDTVVEDQPVVEADKPAGDAAPKPDTATPAEPKTAEEITKAVADLTKQQADFTKQQESFQQDKQALMDWYTKLNAFAESPAGKALLAGLDKGAAAPDGAQPGAAAPNADPNAAPKKPWDEFRDNPEGLTSDKIISYLDAMHDRNQALEQQLTQKVTPLEEARKTQEQQQHEREIELATGETDAALKELKADWPDLVDGNDKPGGKEFELCESAADFMQIARMKKQPMTIKEALTKAARLIGQPGTAERERQRLNKQVTASAGARMGGAGGTGPAKDTRTFEEKLESDFENSEQPS